MEELTIKTLPEGVTESAWAQFQDVKFWLANLYKFCLDERKHLKTEVGLQAVEDSRIHLNADKYVNDLQTFHIWFVTYMLFMNEMQWRNIDLSTSPPPKLSDALLLSLVKHSIFDGRSIYSVIQSGFKLNSAEKRILKELAQRLS